MNKRIVSGVATIRPCRLGPKGGWGGWVKPFDRIQCVFRVNLPSGKNEKFLCTNVNVGLRSKSLHCNALFVTQYSM